MAGYAQDGPPARTLSANHSFECKASHAALHVALLYTGFNDEWPVRVHACQQATKRRTSDIGTRARFVGHHYNTEFNITLVHGEYRSHIHAHAQQHCRQTKRTLKNGNTADNSNNANTSAVQQINKILFVPSMPMHRLAPHANPVGDGGGSERICLAASNAPASEALSHTAEDRQTATIQMHIPLGASSHLHCTVVQLSICTVRWCN